METIFPEETGYAGFFLVGFRKDPAQPARTQRVGTVILKRTYDITPALNPVQGRVTPAANPFPVFDQDVAENLVLNGNMEASQKAFGEGESETLPAAWKAETGAELLLVKDQGRGGTKDTGLQVTGVANSRVVQVISLDEPVGGRGFSLSLWAKADANTNANNVRLEADGSAICNINLALTPVYNINSRFTATGTWPAGVTATEMQVVLRMATMATNAVRTVFYDDVEVSERNYKTKVDVAALRYESDLAPFKPEGDVVVLDFADQAGLNQVYVNGSVWMGRTVSINGDGRDKALFGWASRSEDGVNSRKSDAGTFSADPNAYPPEWPVVDPVRDPLPPGPPASGRFNNRFYNGYRRDSQQLPDLPYLLPAAQVLIQRQGPSNDYGFTLGGETVTAQARYYRGYGPDDERYWRSENVPMHADTLVVEPEKNRCYVVWRGVWDFDAYPEDVYRQLVVSATEP